VAEKEKAALSVLTTEGTDVVMRLAPARSSHSSPRWWPSLADRQPFTNERRTAAARSWSSRCRHQLARLLSFGRMKPHLVSVLGDGTTRTEMRSWLGPHHHKVYLPDLCYVWRRRAPTRRITSSRRASLRGQRTRFPRLLAHKGCNNQYAKPRSTCATCLLSSTPPRATPARRLAPRFLPH